MIDLRAHADALEAGDLSDLTGAIAALREAAQRLEELEAPPIFAKAAPAGSRMDLRDYLVKAAGEPFAGRIAVHKATLRNYIEESEYEIERLRAALSRLIDAGKPFAKKGCSRFDEGGFEGVPDDYFCAFSLGELRALSAALQAAKGVLHG